MRPITLDLRSGRRRINRLWLAWWIVAIASAIGSAALWHAANAIQAQAAVCAARANPCPPLR